MPATTTHFASQRQIDFINSLRRDRGLRELDAVEAAGLTGGRTGTASQEISRLQLLATGSTATATPRGAEVIPTPAQDRRPGRMLAAGGIEATVTLFSGEHVTLKISTRVPRGRGWANGSPSDERARTNIKVLGQRIGWITVVDGQWMVNLRTRREDYRTAVNALFAYAAGQATGGIVVQEASRCGRCMRTLTDPVSIERGIGPECFGRVTGSRHVAAGTVETTVTGNTRTTRNALNMAADALQQAMPVRQRQARVDDAQALIDERERLNDAEFARREREQEEAAFASDPDLGPALQRTGAAARRVAASMAEVAETVREGINTEVARAIITTAEQRDQEQARALMEAALKAYTEDEMTSPAMARAALATFDRLAAGARS